MTTLYGLMTISKLFAGFNLINTGVVNCLIMCQNARKMHYSEAKNPKHFMGWGAQPLPDQPHPLALRRSTCPQNENPGSASACDLSLSSPTP